MDFVPDSLKKQIPQLSDEEKKELYSKPEIIDSKELFVQKGQEVIITNRPKYSPSASDDDAERRDADSETENQYSADIQDDCAEDSNAGDEFDAVLITGTKRDDAGSDPVLDDDINFPDSFSEADDEYDDDSTAALYEPYVTPKDITNL